MNSSTSPPFETSDTVQTSRAAAPYLNNFRGVFFMLFFSSAEALIVCRRNKNKIELKDTIFRITNIELIFQVVETF